MGEVESCFVVEQEEEMDEDLGRGELEPPLKLRLRSLPPDDSMLPSILSPRFWTRDSSSMLVDDSLPDPSSLASGLALEEARRSLWEGAEQWGPGQKDEMQLGRKGTEIARQNTQLGTEERKDEPSREGAGEGCRGFWKGGMREPHPRTNGLSLVLLGRTRMSGTRGQVRLGKGEEGRRGRGNSGPRKRRRKRRRSGRSCQVVGHRGGGR